MPFDVSRPDLTLAGIGAARVLGILDALQDYCGDPRYRASAWLRRRARLGVSLLTSEA
jgi:3-hydroxybutyryl-CoA dehydrogenase